MKRKLQFLLIIASVTFISSCTMEKRVYMPGYNVEWKKFNNSKDKINVVKKENSTIITDQRNDNNKLIPINSNDIGTEENITASIDNSNIIIRKSIIIPKLIPNKIVNPNQESTKIKNGFKSEDPCDIIILKNGSEISAKVIEISSNEIKYKKCDYIDGPTVSLNKSDVFMIKYSNGTKEIISQNTSTSNNSSNSDKDLQVKKEHTSSGFGIASFVTGIVGLIIAGVVFGPIAIVFGCIGLGKQRKLKGLAIAGLVLGIIDLVAAILIIAAIL